MASSSGYVHVHVAIERLREAPVLLQGWTAAVDVLLALLVLLLLLLLRLHAQLQARVLLRRDLETGEGASA